MSANDHAAAEELVDELLKEAGAREVHITEEIGREARGAAATYGKVAGHAALNMGDCFASACARAHHVRLLYKGDDLSRTDLA